MPPNASQARALIDLRFHSVSTMLPSSLRIKKYQLTIFSLLVSVVNSYIRKHADRRGTAHGKQTTMANANSAHFVSAIESKFRFKTFFFIPKKNKKNDSSFAGVIIIIIIIKATTFSYSAHFLLSAPLSTAELTETSKVLTSIDYRK